MERKEFVSQWDNRPIEDLVDTYVNLGDKKISEARVPEWLRLELKEVSDWVEKSVPLIVTGEVGVGEIIEGLIDWYDDSVENKFDGAIAVLPSVLYTRGKLGVAEVVHLGKEMAKGFLGQEEGKRKKVAVLTEAVRYFLMYGILAQERYERLTPSLVMNLKAIGREREANIVANASFRPHKGQFN